MSFIQGIATQVAKQGKALEWKTPTGFIVQQEIFKMKVKRVDSQLLGGTQFTVQEEADEIDANKMRSSAAPNYVHSMDASHLIKSVNAFKAAGLDSIAVIHDSFGTHAGKTDALRSCLKQVFVEIYQDDWLAAFKYDAEETLLEEIEAEVPHVGTLDLQDVLESSYAFA